MDDSTAAGARLLEPYAGRAVINAGAVTCHGVVDDYLSQAPTTADVWLVGPAGATVARTSEGSTTRGI